jgi:hypothetical protein
MSTPERNCIGGPERKCIAAGEHEGPRYRGPTTETAILLTIVILWSPLARQPPSFGLENRQISGTGSPRNPERSRNRSREQQSANASAKHDQRARREASLTLPSHEQLFGSGLWDASRWRTTLCRSGPHWRRERLAHDPFRHRQGVLSAQVGFTGDAVRLALFRRYVLSKRATVEPQILACRLAVVGFGACPDMLARLRVFRCAELVVQLQRRCAPHHRLCDYWLLRVNRRSTPRRRCGGRF